MILFFYSANSFAGTSVKEIMIEDFEFPAEKVFTVWLKRNHTDQEAGKIYAIQQEQGNAFLHADTTRNPTLSIQLGKVVNAAEIGPDKQTTTWDLKNYPWLRWDWRVHKLPKKGDESKIDLNDSAAGIYVAIQKNKIPFLSWKFQPVNVLKYVWSTTLPEGTIIHRNFKFLGMELYRVAYLVIQSGENKSKSWITEKRNIVEDYRKVFGAEPRFSPVLLGVLTDSNATLSEASADFDNFAVRSE